MSALSAAEDRAALEEAREHLSAAFEIIDDVGPRLPEPERAAVVGTMGLRHDLASVIRRGGAVIAFLDAGKGGAVETMR